LAGAGLHTLVVRWTASTCGSTRVRRARRVRRGPIRVRQLRRVHQVRRGPIRVRRVRRGCPILGHRDYPILGRPLGSCRGSLPRPSCRPTLDPRNPPGTIVGTDPAVLGRQSRHQYRRIPDRRRARLLPRPYVPFYSWGLGYPVPRSPNSQRRNRFRYVIFADQTDSALARTREGNGRGLTATVTCRNYGLRSVTSTG
jgi:hypothetical protein